MSAPEKCPECGASNTTLHPSVRREKWIDHSCGTREWINDPTGRLDQSGLCLLWQRDALRAANAELDARLAASVTRDVAKNAVLIYIGDQQGLSLEEFRHPGSEPFIAEAEACLTRAEAEAASAAQGGDHAG